MPKANDRPIDEKLLWKLWQAGKIPSHCLTSDLAPIQIISRGRWSGGYGPDFRDALILLGNKQLLRGDIELHVRMSDWYRHNHQTNPLYENVILHVVWELDVPYPLKSPCLELSRFMTFEELLAAGHKVDLTENPCVRISQKDPEALRLVIESAADERFEGWCRRFEGDLSYEHSDQVIYVALMESLGYSANKLPFRLLAESIHVKALMGLAPEEIFDLLYTSSGLKGKSEGTVISSYQWNLARMRPLNHPRRRLAGMAEILHRAYIECRSLSDYLRVSSNSYTSLVKKLVVFDSQGKALIGRGRAMEMIVNVVLPFNVALGRHIEDQQIESLATRMWQEIPLLPTNKIDRLMRSNLKLQAPGKLIYKARHQQGLLQIYKKFCRYQMCAHCPLGKLASDHTTQILDDR
ncbi:hypothetical protein Tter_1813 [Thermobaculum terrenum ATCC BAA-798]|uniref:DUF2851 domain-containing protein n=1 Tax=Thermobaculum terrenum (strain ATCC BAA-798 / CCMEE 7001 / YNP1) TaxID=525904 RepID=D1CD54_THET1|nr:DUF2851 family protein [Thermobaculum terrenum]ACZ42719.1 hypothetical protein Tter_1813 [Thermobaculum terrenum ATCC BAA-798]